VTEIPSPYGFTPYSGDLIGLTADENHLVFRWNKPGCKVLFSVARRGDAASCHFASDFAGLRQLKKAIEEFVLYVFWLFDWCKMVSAQVLRPSVCKLLEKCDFNYWFNFDGVSIYRRLR
jgi:hypothetical protein